MILLIPSGLLLAALVTLYRWRMRSVPWAFLLAASVVILQGSIIEAFGVQAGAEVGSSSLIVLLVVTIAGFFVIKPVWRMEMAAILCVLGAILALLAYAGAGLYFADLDTRMDETPILLVPLALVLATAGVMFSRDLSWPPRRLMIVAVAVMAVYPLTQIGERVETIGSYLAYLAVALLLTGWIWLVYSLRRAERRRVSGDLRPPP
jgi:hypothetical protein